MYCPKCGEKNPDEAKFCGSCGAALPAGERVDPRPQPVTRRPPPKESSAVSSEMKVGIAVASAVIPIIGLIMGAIYLRDENESKKAAGKLWLIIAIGMTVLYCFFASLGSY